MEIDVDASAESADSGVTLCRDGVLTHAGHQECAAAASQSTQDADVFAVVEKASRGAARRSTTSRLPRGGGNAEAVNSAVVDARGTANLVGVMEAEEMQRPIPVAAKRARTFGCRLHSWNLGRTSTASRQEAGNLPPLLSEDEWRRCAVVPEVRLRDWRSLAPFLLPPRGPVGR